MPLLDGLHLLTTAAALTEAIGLGVASAVEKLADAGALSVPGIEHPSVATGGQ